MIKRIFCLLLAVLMLAGAFPLSALAEDDLSVMETVSGDTVPEPEVTAFDLNLWDDIDAEEVYEYYMDSEFYPDRSPATFGTVGREELSGYKAKLYDALKPYLKKIANGQRKSAKFTIGTSMYGKSPEIKVSLKNMDAQDIFDVLAVLALDMPYEMYWTGGQCCVWTWKSGSSRYFELMFNIWPPFHNGKYSKVTFSNGSTSKYYHTADLARTGAAKKAAANARDLVTRYAGQTDYQKLLGYAKWIADNVQYEHNGTDRDKSRYTLINAFDGDPNTDVVCMGYAKAFQYLCDLSTFSRVTCHYVTGYTWTNGIRADVGHAWNLVDVEGTRYLIDVTGYDTDTNGRYSTLYFMAGASRNTYGRYPIAYWEYEHDKQDLRSLFGSTNVNMSKTYYDTSSVSYAAVEEVEILQGSSEVTGDTIYLPLGETIMLDSQVHPATSRQAVKWSSSDKEVLTVSSDGVLTPLKKGTVTVKAKATDSTGESAAVTVKVIRKMTSLKLPETLSLTAGKSYTFSPDIAPGSTSIKTLSWNLSGDTGAAVLSTKGVLTAKDTASRRYVIVTASSKDGSNLSAVCNVTIYPPATGVTLYDEAASSVSGETVKVAMGKTLDLGFQVAPQEARQSVKWKSSDKKIATVDSNGIVTPVKPGKVTITATTRDGMSKKSTVTIQVVRLVSSITLPENLELTSGAQYTFEPGIKPSSATSKRIKWTLTGETEAASLSSKGVLTAQSVTRKHTVTVTATARDGSGVSASCVVTIHPKATGLSIQQNGSDVTGQSFRWEMDDSLVLKAVVAPADARQSVRWKSSDTGIAKISSSGGTVTPVKPGKVTFTATTRDGTKKSAQVTVTFYKLMDSLKISGDSAVMGGKNITLKASPSPSYTSNKSVSWEIWNDGGLENISISSKGVLTTPEVAEATVIQIGSFARDDSGTCAFYDVTIRPAAEEVTILLDGSSVTSASVKKGKKIDLDAAITPGDAGQKVTWKSSDTDIATVSSSGVVKGKSKGTVTITAKAADGSGRKATIKVKVK